MARSRADVSRAVASIPDAGNVAVGYSGGLDSTVLLHAAAKRLSAGRLRALHVNHGVQSGSLGWQHHCERVASDLGVPIEVLRVTVAAGNVEAEARRARYEAWRKALRPSELLLLGHHANDQAETVLWRLFTGRAPVGMPQARLLGGGRLVRPFLHLPRSQLVAYAEAHDLDWVEDPSNADRSLDRNFIRHEIMPHLEARFPRAVEILSSVAPGTFAEPDPSLPIDGLMSRDVRAWLRDGVPERRVEEILRQAGAAADANPVIRLPGGDTVRRYGDRLFRVSHLSMREVRASANTLIRAGRRERLPHGTIGWRRAGTGVVDGLELTVRYRAGSERLAPAGRGVSKRLKTLFQEHRIPPWQRDAWPLLFSGDLLAAVPGVAVAENFAVQGGWHPEWTPN